MELTQERLIELGWITGNFEGHSFMVNRDRVLVNIAGVWALGRLVFGEPYLPLSHPIYIYNEAQLNSLM